MKLEQFEQVLELVKTGTFSQAARNLFMSQPNLSLSIKQLEKELNCKLFVRSSGGVVPTEEAKALIDHMTKIQSEYHTLKEYSQSKKATKLSLHIAMVNLNRVTPCFVRIAKKYMASPINFSFINCVSLDNLIEKVETCQVDFALVGVMEPYAKNTIAKLQNHHIEFHPFDQSDVYAVVGPENDYYDRTEPLTLADMASQTIITFGSPSEDPYGALYDASRLQINSKGRISVNNAYLFYETLQNTEALGIISCKKEAFSQGNTWKDLRLLPISDFPLYSQAGWIKLERMPLRDIAKELIEDLHSVF